MRLNFTLFILLLCASFIQAQKITGIWRGYFSSSIGIGRDAMRTENYKYEVQIDQLANNSIRGVTYSYKTTVFYGKAELTGIYNATSKSLIIKETKLVDLKVSDNSEPCLMTCYLDYTKIGKLEILEGTFISINAKDKGDCGSGKVYLERVPVSDFIKEDFLVKKKTDEPAKATQKPTPKPTTVVPPTKPATNTNKQSDTKKSQDLKGQTAQKKAKPPVSNTPKNTPAKPQPNAKKVPDTKTTGTEKAVERIPETPVNAPKNKIEETQKTETPNRNIPLPKVLVERENNLVRTITTSEENIQVELYDNGTIDNDSITVYHNNQLVISNGRLSFSPISFKIKCSVNDSRHELIVVAENLGDIPPNTALMVIKAGGKERYEVFLASTEQRNAKVIINYVPKD